MSKEIEFSRRMTFFSKNQLKTLGFDARIESFKVLHAPAATNIPAVLKIAAIKQCQALLDGSPWKRSTTSRRLPGGVVVRENALVLCSALDTIQVDSPYYPVEIELGGIRHEGAKEA